jgi:pimeloyl-ACP methyl ester carboxylesterase
LTDSDVSFHEIYYTARDGLRLYARHYPAANAAGRQRPPVLCLPGLTRNSRDFDRLAQAICNDKERGSDVYTLDYRGRGASEFDNDWRNYALQIELFDILDFITLKDLRHVSVVGTSRGGLLTMLIGAAQPTTLGAVVLNDIGPVIEAAGLTRISGYVGRMPPPQSWQQAAALVRKHNENHFTNLEDQDWDDVARQWFNDKDGRPVAGYDGDGLAKALAPLLDGPVPPLWAQFETLKHVPLLVLRGQNSDILSTETVDAMLRRHPRAMAHVVEDEGHAPLLRDDKTANVILDFLANAHS